MRIVDPSVLELFRGYGNCEVCLRLCRWREAHHLFSRGAGRLDIRENLLAVGSTLAWQCDCHTRIHAGLVTRRALLEIVAVREGVTVEAIEELVWRLRRLPKGSVPEFIRKPTNKGD